MLLGTTLTFSFIVTTYSSSLNNSSAVADMAAQCCTSRTVPLFDALFLTNLWEYNHKSYIAENYISK